MSETATTALRSGDVIRYVPDPSRFEPRWCREGTAVVREDGKAVDTYWGSGSDNHVLLDVEVTTAEVVFNLADYIELDQYRPGVQAEWAKYREDQRHRITSQHGLQSRYFVLNGAEPDLEQQISNAYEALTTAREALNSAARDLEWKAQAVARLEAQR